MTAVQNHNDSAVIQLLLESGADMNVKDYKGLYVLNSKHKKTKHIFYTIALLLLFINYIKKKF